MKAILVNIVNQIIVCRDYSGYDKISPWKNLADNLEKNKWTLVKNALEK